MTSQYATPYEFGDEARICRDCGQPWVLSSRERNFFLARCLSLPLRCTECRRQRRDEKAASADRAKPYADGLREIQQHEELEKED